MATNLLYENKGIHGGDFFFFNGEQNKNIERQKDGRWQRTQNCIMMIDVSLRRPGVKDQWLIENSA